MTTNSAIIVAAGSGVRMGGGVRKQYLLLGGRPILAHTLAPFDEFNGINEIFLVVPETDFDYCRNAVISPMKPRKKIRLVPGGATRQESVYNGLLAIGGNQGVVVIHDGVRPFITMEQIAECIEVAEKTGACILGMPVFDTLKRVNHAEEIEKTVEREAIRSAQTPQAFQYRSILEAHEIARREGYTGTDDASLMEHIGKRVKIITGDRRNIKITTPEDLDMAEAILESGWIDKPKHA